MAGIAFMEHVTHAWDIAKATGQDASFPDDLVKECLEVVTPMDAMLRMSGVCGPKIDVPADAPLIDQLAGFMGRQPQVVAPISAQGHTGSLSLAAYEPGGNQPGAESVSASACDSGDGTW